MPNPNNFDVDEDGNLILPEGAEHWHLWRNKSLLTRWASLRNIKSTDAMLRQQMDFVNAMYPPSYIGTAMFSFGGKSHMMKHTVNACCLEDLIVKSGTAAEWLDEMRACSDSCSEAEVKAALTEAVMESEAEQVAEAIMAILFSLR